MTWKNDGKTIEDLPDKLDDLARAYAIAMTNNKMAQSIYEIAERRLEDTKKAYAKAHEALLAESKNEVDR